MPSFPRGSSYICVYRDIFSNYLPLNQENCFDNVLARRKKLFEMDIKENILYKELNRISDLYDNFLYFDPTNSLCDDKTKCKAYDGSKLITIDGIHYSKNAAKDIYSDLNKELNKKRFLK